MNADHRQSVYDPQTWILIGLVIGALIVAAWRWNHPPLSPRFEIRLAKAETSLSLGDARGAAHAFRYALTLDETNAAVSIRSQIAHVLYYVRKYPTDTMLALGVRQLERIREQDPRAMAALGSLMARNHRESEAISVLRRAIERWPEAAFARCELLASLWAVGEIREAQEVFAQALRQDPGLECFVTPSRVGPNDAIERREIVLAYEALRRAHPSALSLIVRTAQANIQAGDLGAAIDAQRELVRELEKLNEREDENHRVWFFDTRSGTVFLNSVPSKKAYAAYTLSWLYFLHGDSLAAKKVVYPNTDRRTLKRARNLVAHDLATLTDYQPMWRERVGQYRQQFRIPRISRARPIAPEWLRQKLAN